MIDSMQLSSIMMNYGRYTENKTSGREQVNKYIKEMEQLAKENGFHIPPFCNWTPEEWQEKGHEYDEIRDNMLGWDITDYGLGDFEKVGFALITLRNGNQHNPKYKKVYAEKLLMLKEGQHSPMHFHWVKSEDIINRGGGTLIIHVYNDAADEDIGKRLVVARVHIASALVGRADGAV